MNKIVAACLCCSMICMTSPVLPQEDINQYRDATDDLWRKGTGAEDGAFTATAASMLGWGVALTAAIAILVCILPQSGTTAHSD